MLDASSRAGWGSRWSATTVTKLSTTLTTCQTPNFAFQRTQYKDCVIITTITDIIITNLGSQKTCYKARGRRPPSRSPLFASRPGCGDFVTLARFGLGFVKIKIEIWIWQDPDFGFGFAEIWALVNLLEHGPLKVSHPRLFSFKQTWEKMIIMRDCTVNPSTISTIDWSNPPSNSRSGSDLFKKTTWMRMKRIKNNSPGFPTSQLTSSLAGWKKSERNPFTLSKLMFPQTTTNWRWLGA